MFDVGGTAGTNCVGYMLQETLQRISEVVAAHKVTISTKLVFCLVVVKEIKDHGRLSDAN